MIGSSGRDASPRNAANSAALSVVAFKKPGPYTSNPALPAAALSHHDATSRNSRVACESKPLAALMDAARNKHTTERLLEEIRNEMGKTELQ